MKVRFVGEPVAIDRLVRAPNGLDRGATIEVYVATKIQLAASHRQIGYWVECEISPPDDSSPTEIVVTRVRDELAHSLPHQPSQEG